MGAEPAAGPRRSHTGPAHVRAHTETLSDRRASGLCKHCRATRTRLARGSPSRTVSCPRHGAFLSQQARASGTTALRRRACVRCSLSAAAGGALLELRRMGRSVADIRIPCWRFPHIVRCA